MTSCLSPAHFKRLIEPLASQLLPGDEREFSLCEVVVQILKCAQSFVPCEAGSIMLCHPDIQDALVFVASFGTGSEQLPGTVLPAGTGIAGQVYSSGEPVLTNSPAVESSFYHEIDKLTQYQTESLLCVPVTAFGRPVGVLNLLNAERGQFSQEDLELLNVFGDYLTQSVQLMIEARRQREKALRDHLSGLYNGRFLYRFLNETIASALDNDFDIGLIFMDLDHFKSVVDTHGHLVGSQALREIGHLVGECVEDTPGMAARYGGDEYAIVLPETPPRKVKKIAETLRRAIERAEITCEGERGQEAVHLRRLVTASIGAANLKGLLPSDQSPSELRQQLIRAADKAMYVAKDLGKNRVHWAGDPVIPVAPATP